MYDFVIVGAGSAGCVLAHRLLEAGSLRHYLDDHVVTTRASNHK